MNRATIIFTVLLFSACAVYARQKDKTKKDIYVEIPYEVVAGIPVIDVQIKGKTYKFVLDTGASGVHVTRKVVDQSLLRLKRKTKGVGDTNGVRKQQQQAVINDIRIGELLFSTSGAYVSENDSYIFSCYGFDGIIGGDFLKQFAVKFDSRAKIVILATDVSRLVPSQQRWSKMFLVSSKTFFRIETEGYSSKNILFDSGSNSPSLGVDTVKYRMYKELGVWEVTNEETGYGATSVGLHGEMVNEKKYRAVASEFSFGGYTFYNVPVTTTRVPKAGFVLTSFGDIILDYPGKRYCFIPHQAEVDWKNTRYKVGFSVKDSGLIVAMVWGEEMATKIAVGDKVVKVGSQQLNSVDRCFRTSMSSLIGQYTTPENNTILLEKPDGTQYTLSVDVFL